MNILFLSYWGSDEGLSKATVIPHLRILAEMERVETIVYCSIERQGKSIEPLTLDKKITHVPLYSGTSYLHKILDFTGLPRKLIRLAKQYAIEVLICRGAPAGSLGYLVNRKLGIPYMVESFEPHAIYMVESGVWRSGGLKYRSQHRWENRQLVTATAIVTVSENYKTYLASQGADEKRLAVAACAVDPARFSFDEVARDRIRANVGFGRSAIVGVYVGKFGGLYYDDVAFQIFAEAFKTLPEFCLLILSPDNTNTIIQKLEQVGIPSGRYFVTHALHEDVPAYLSAADIAFALYKPSPSKRFLSPIKVGEYWANGLPVLLTRGVGDDADIIESEGGGATFIWEEQGSFRAALDKIKGLLVRSNRPQLSESILKLALKYRSFDRVREIYEKVLLSR